MTTVWSVTFSRWPLYGRDFSHRHWTNFFVKMTTLKNAARGSKRAGGPLPDSNWPLFALTPAQHATMATSQTSQCPVSGLTNAARAQNENRTNNCWGEILNNRLTRFPLASTLSYSITALVICYAPIVQRPDICCFLRWPAQVSGQTGQQTAQKLPTQFVSLPARKEPKWAGTWPWLSRSRQILVFHKFCLNVSRFCAHIMPP